MITRIVVFALFVLVLAAPFLFRPSVDPPPENARRLIIVTPHNEQIRTEFRNAFNLWHQERFGEAVNVVYNVPGGTSEIRKMLESQFEAALERGDEPGGAADLVFGGGSYEHTKLKQGVSVTVNGEERSTSISQPLDFDQAWLDEIYGPNDVGGVPLFDPDQYWFGTALSGFGIVYNRDALAELDIPEPESWDDLGHPDLVGWVALVNPGQSGSVTTAFQAILERCGWGEGWRILRRAGANSRYFSASSLKPPTDVSQGNAAMGVCIDFYGRYQSQAVISAGGGERLGYVDPPGVTAIDPDPISMLRNAPHPELAKRFIEFCLTETAQALWQFPAHGPEAPDELGPTQFELRRLPIRRLMYEKHLDRMIDRVNPFAFASPPQYPNRDKRSFIAVVFSAMAMDNHEPLIDAWRAITSHPNYPRTGEIVTAADPRVTDPVLREMLARFDAMPPVPTPDGSPLSMETADDLDEIKRGWLDGEWSDAGLWPANASPAAELRRRFAEYYRGQYEAIVELAETGETTSPLPGPTPAQPIEPAA